MIYVIKSKSKATFFARVHVHIGSCKYRYSSTATNTNCDGKLRSYYRMSLLKYNGSASS